jgi:hypothetical protein
MDSATICQRPRISARRRSKRIALTVPVEISGKDAEQCSFTLTTTASNLNRNGAMLQLNRDLVADSVLVIQNARRARASARVVSQTVLSDNLYKYGIEFVEADHDKDFWGISFPLSSQSRGAH